MKTNYQVSERERELRFSRAEKGIRPNQSKVNEMIALANQKLSNQNGRLVFPAVNNY